MGVCDGATHRRRRSVRVAVRGAARAGSRCATCSFVTFPAQDACPSCGGDAVAPTLLSRTGTLWTWTRQRFQPKNPPYLGREPANEFVPYGVGFIELPEGRIEARLAGPSIRSCASACRWS